MSAPTERLSAALADRYRILRPLGAGGMATVYLAEDLKHDRQVAVKVLKPELAAVLGAERFVVEIKTTASMSHPHILPLFDSGTADGFLFYVMPYVEGETLRSKLNRETQFSVEEAVRITREVADALAYAHSRGVIHRDIKPENILLQGGSALVADFGIALAVSAAAGGRMTETGLSLGTPHYMSPEQATAEKEITGRSDVYSLASVCYEMLTGQPPHLGGSAQQIIMKIITEQALPVTQHRRSVPPHVAAAVAKALEKLPADRFESAQAFSEALANQGFSVPQTMIGGVAVGRAAGASVGARVGYAALGLVLGALAVGGVAFTWRPTPAPPEVVRFEMTFAPGVHLDIQTDEDAPFALSPDGRHVVFATRDSVDNLGPLHIREIGQLGSTPLPGTEGGQAPFFSPDGQWIGYATQDGLLRKVATAGGPPITLARDVQASMRGGNWGDDGFVWYTSRDFTPARIRATGGEPEVLRARGSDGLFWPHVLPGGSTSIYTRCTANCAETDVVLFDLATKGVRVLVPGAQRGWYLPPGQLLYMTADGTMFAVPFDLASGEIRGTPTVALDGVRTGATLGTRFAVSVSGSALYLPGVEEIGSQIVAVDRNGREETIVPEIRDYGQPRWSPTGDRIAVRRAGSGGLGQIWIYDMASKTFAQLTKDGDNARPSWSPDGRRVAYFSTQGANNDLYWIPADGSGPAEKVLADEDVANFSTTSWTPDGSRILFDGRSTDSSASEDIFAVGTGGTRTREVVLATADEEQDAQVSPDGRWLAYVSDEGGPWQVYVRPFLREGGRWLISTGPAANPLWASNGELTYRDFSSRDMIAARLAMGPDGVRVLERTTLFSGQHFYMAGQGTAQHDISKDGRRFLMLRRPERATDAAPPVMILNWSEEIRQRMQQQGARAP